MSIATSPSKFPRSLAAPTLISMALISWLGFLPAGMTSAAAQAMPDTENGRYALSPVTDGVVRLDTRTGAVSTCSNSGAGWACYTVPDERAALDAEIGRLLADNEKSKTELEKSKTELEKNIQDRTGKIQNRAGNIQSGTGKTQGGIGGARTCRHRQNR